ncbi:MAG: hypothetical protein PVH37_23800, partial [Desulfobacterales bacterium]
MKKRRKDKSKQLKDLKKRKRTQSYRTNPQTTCPAHESSYQLFTKKTPRRRLMPVAVERNNIIWKLWTKGREYETFVQ